MNTARAIISIAFSLSLSAALIGCAAPVAQLDDRMAVELAPAADVDAAPHESAIVLGAEMDLSPPEVVLQEEMARNIVAESPTANNLPLFPRE